MRARGRTREAQAKSDQLATQVDRRISELFSLQELSYVLSQSIQLDRIADQVAKYAARFLQADGAIVVLAEGELLRVVAATGTLEPLLGEVSDEPDSLIAPGHRARPHRGRRSDAATPAVRLLGRDDGPLGRRGAAAGPGHHHGSAGSGRPPGRPAERRGSAGCSPRSPPTPRWC